MTEVYAGELVWTTMAAAVRRDHPLCVAGYGANPALESSLVERLLDVRLDPVEHRVPMPVRSRGSVRPPG